MKNIQFHQHFNVDEIDPRAFQRFGQAQFPNDGYVLGLSQFSILPPTYCSIQKLSKLTQK